MNVLKQLTLTLSVTLSTSFLFAQDKTKPDIAGKWHIKNVVYLNDGDGLGVTEYSEKNNGVVKVNKQAKVEWEIPVDGKHILGMGKYKDNAIIFYIDHGDWDDRSSTFKRIEDIHSAIVDLKSHQLTNDKVVYTASDYIYPEVNNDLAGNFINLSIRTTKKNSPEDTKKLTILTLGADGNGVQKELSTAAINGWFIDMLVNKEGSTFVASTVNGSMIVEKFNSNGSPETKLEVPLDIKETYLHSYKMGLDPNANNTVITGIRYVKKDKNRWISFCQFNFDEKKAVSIEDVPLEKGSPYKFRDQFLLKPQNILFTKDKIILVKEIQDLNSTASGSQIIYESESAVVSIYDKQLHALQNIVIPKKLQSFTPTSVGLSCFIKNEKLYLLSTELYSVGALENYCYVIDLNSGKLEKKKIGYNKPNSSRTVATYSTFWFPNECVVSHLFFEKFFGVKFDTVLEKISYDDIDKLAAIN